MILPKDHEAEELALASMLVDNGPSFLRALQLGVAPTDFDHPANQLIFESFSELLAQGKPIDLACLALHLRTTNRLETVGGMPYLLQVTDTSNRITTAKVDAFLKRIKNLSLTRALMTEASRLISVCAANQKEEIVSVVSPSISRLLSIASGGFGSSEPSFSQILSLAEQAADQIIEYKGPPPGQTISFPWPQMDSLFGPMVRGQLVLIAARTSIGKSSLARPIVVSAAKSNLRVYYVTLEVTCERVVLNMAASISGVGVRQLGKSHASDQQDFKRAINSLKTAKITMSRRDRTLAQIVARARALHVSEGLDLLVIDHGLLLDDCARASRDEKPAVIGQVTKTLKHLATDLGIVVVMLWQLNRDSVRDSNREPQKSDLKDSGSLEEDADKILMIHRPSTNPLTGQAQADNSRTEECPSFFQNIIQAKGRDEGETFMSFYFQRSTATFRPVK